MTLTIYPLHLQSEMETSSKPQNISLKAISVLPQKAQISTTINPRVENCELDNTLAQAKRKAMPNSHWSWSAAFQDIWDHLLSRTQVYVFHQHARIFQLFASTLHCPLPKPSQLYWKARQNSGGRFCSSRLQLQHSYIQGTSQLMFSLFLLCYLFSWSK